MYHAARIDGLLQEFCDECPIFKHELRRVATLFSRTKDPQNSKDAKFALRLLAFPLVVKYSDFDMRTGKSFYDILELDIPERIQIVEDIWDSIAASPEAVPLTDAQRQELDRRLAAYHHDPSAGSPWDQVKQRILESK